jgi:hypothetical protein
MPIVSAQETRTVSFTVERVGEAGAVSPMVIAVLAIALLGVGVYAAVTAWNRYRASQLPKVRARVEEKAYEEHAPATYAMEHIIIEDEVEKHLKEDERIIVRLLRQREGKCEQGTLCVVSDFSKATLSRLLAELEARGIVRKERQGKKNMVYLRI